MTPVGAVMVVLMPRAPAKCFCHKDDVAGMALPDISSCSVARFAVSASKLALSPRGAEPVKINNLSTGSGIAGTADSGPIASEADLVPSELTAAKQFPRAQ